MLEVGREGGGRERREGEVGWRLRKERRKDEREKETGDTIEGNQIRRLFKVVSYLPCAAFRGLP